MHRLSRFRRCWEKENSFSAVRGATHTAYPQVRSSVPFDETAVTMLYRGERVILNPRARRDRLRSAERATGSQIRIRESLSIRRRPYIGAVVVTRRVLCKMKEGFRSD